MNIVVEKSNQLKILSSLIESDVGRFGAYQNFPRCIVDRIPEVRKFNYSQTQIDLDQARFDWLQQCLSDITINEAIEIGSNLGFFSFALADAKDCMVQSYETISEYVKICNILASLSRIDNKVSFHDKSLCLDDLHSLRRVDLILHLNVLHHAGCVFDIFSPKDISKWYDYAVTYLTVLAQKSRYLFFQVGNMWEGDSLFNGKLTIPFIFDLLDAASWRVQKIGVITDLETCCYTTYEPSDISNIPIIYCQRNNETGKVDYLRDGIVMASKSTGLAQRPLWFCESQYNAT